jgi:phosphoglycolate phosphatase
MVREGFDAREAGGVRRWDALVFDLDGTLWDATEASAVGWSEAARAHGLDVTLSAADIGRVCGMPFEACARTLFPDLDDGRLQALMPDLHRHEEAAVRERGGRIYPGVGDGLRRLAAADAPLFVLSNCTRWYLELFLERAGLAGVFRGTLCHGDTGLDKAGNLRLLRERHGLRAPVYVGDTASDAAASRAAGYDFAYAAYGFGEVEAPRLESFAAVCAALAPRLG